MARRKNGQTTIYKTLHIKEFEDTKGIIRIRITKKDRQHNGQKKKDKRKNNDLQNTTQKTKDRVTRTPKTCKLNHA
jgi:hypothetical protein